MGLSFECGNCGRSYQVSSSLGGKKARCKDCGGEMRIPLVEPVSLPSRKPTPAARPSPDLFAVEDLPPRRSLYEVEDEPVPPRRAPAPRQRKARPSRPRSDSDEYDIATMVNMRGLACFSASFLIAAFFYFCFGVMPGQQIEFSPSGMINAATGLLVLGGFLMMASSFVVAIVRILGAGEFPRPGLIGAFSWLISMLFVGGSLASVVYLGPGKVFQPKANPPAVPDPAALARAGLPPPTLPPAGAMNPPPNFVTPRGRAQDEVVVSLSDGQVRRNTNPLGATFPGVQVQVSYNVESGRARGEKYCLMIKSRTNRAKLITLTLKGSGALSGTIPVGSIDDGPFEAWMEAESFNGQNSRRVSETITLRQVESAPVTPPGMNPPGAGQQPGMRPGFPGPMGPPGLNRGPRGPRGRM